MGSASSLTDKPGGWEGRLCSRKDPILSQLQGLILHDFREMYINFSNLSFFICSMGTVIPSFFIEGSHSHQSIELGSPVARVTNPCMGTGVWWVVRALGCNSTNAATIHVQRPRNWEVAERGLKPDPSPPEFTLSISAIPLWLLSHCFLLKRRRFCYKFIFH